MSAPLVGQGVDRVDARLKVTGKARYAAEVPVANVVYAVIVTSGIARGRIAQLDLSRARSVPGVLEILSHENAPQLPGAKVKQEGVDRVLQLLQDPSVLYADQPIAVAIADTLERAQEAAALVTATYGTETAALDMPALLPKAYEAKSAGPRGAASSSRGDIAAALKAAPVSIEQTYTTPVQNHHPMEMHGLTVVWQGSDHLTLYDTSQGIFGVRKKVSTVFGIPPENVRVISHYVGGGFGSKGSPWSHVVLCAMAARAVGRAVRLVLTRQQMCSLVGHRPQTVQKLLLAAQKDGTLSAIRHTTYSETSSFDEFVEPSGVQSRMLYACPNVQTSHHLVRLDVPTPTFMRAPGESSGTFALESAMDELAYALKMDPIAFRLKNYAERDPHEDKPWSSKSLRECYRRAADRFGWQKRKLEPRTMREGNLLVGWGMATATYPARQSGSSARVRLNQDGSLLVQAGSQDIGTGTYTILSQIAADVFALPLERVTVELGDTALPETPVSGGSQTASSTGSAVKHAALALRDDLIALALADAASPLHGAKPDEITVDSGALVHQSDASKRDGYASLLTRSGKPALERALKNEEKAARAQYSSHSFGAQLVEVHVDPDLGQVRVKRVVSAFAAGKILNAKTARSQFLGGIVWGIGFALFEHTVRDPRTGRVVTRDFADYHVPVHADIPELDVILVPEEDPYVNEVGAKGIGEIGITGSNAAVANAVWHATGRRVRDLPLTLDKLL
ncbi:MAG TPA: xanthine dehydrogenase family protein molybdopterin-binding subunit [Polyangiaceae bacterium]|jgi:xanthine dehydrogenase YagR molybdenum-binding subunit